MTLNKAKGRMFKSVGWTWNPISGCTHDCKYCWAKSLRDRWGKDFEPKLREKFLKDKMPDDGSWIFVGSMGDVFCDDIPNLWINQLLIYILRNETNNKFLLQTKNPDRFLEYNLDCVKDKIILGTTIETNRDTLSWSRAPKTFSRMYRLAEMKLEGYKTFLSMEPLADFDLPIIKTWLMSIQPEVIEIGLENYTHFTESPPENKIIQLIEWIDRVGFEYVLKENLQGYELNHSHIKEVGP